jgi:lysophospholipase L1-like esterase
VVGWGYSVNGKKGELSAATYAKLLDIFNRELISSCRVDSVEVFDLAAEIPHSGDYFYDTMHFNEKGAELVAEKISDYLESHR